MTFTDRHSIGNTRPLTIDDIRHAAPSALAVAPAADRSARYAYIPTIDVIAGMQKAGFLPVPGFAVALPYRRT